MTDVFRGSIEVNFYEFMENFSYLGLVWSPLPLVTSFWCPSGRQGKHSFVDQSSGESGGHPMLSVSS
jgi:hypothetical protein